MLLTIPQAAEKLGISRQRAHLLVKQKRIVAVRVGEFNLIDSKEVSRFKRKVRTNGRPKGKANATTEK